MGRGRSSAGGGGGGGAAPAVQQVTPTVATAVNPAVYGPFTDMDDADAANMRSVNTDTYDDPDVTAAVKLYISDSNPNGDGFAHAQNLNYKLDNGLPLNATEQYIDDNIQAGMHDLGRNANLVRYAHDDILKQCGISNYANMTEAQLQNKLVGMEFDTTSYMSTSYDASKSPFAPGNPLGGGREVVMNVKASGNTKVILGAKKQAEIVVNKGTRFRITGIHYDGTTAHPRNGGSKPRVVLDIETVN
jgi:hypothetical protein